RSRMGKAATLDRQGVAAGGSIAKLLQFTIFVKAVEGNIPGQQTRHSCKDDKGLMGLITLRGIGRRGEAGAQSALENRPFLNRPAKQKVECFFRAVDLGDALAGAHDKANRQLKLG